MLIEIMRFLNVDYQSSKSLITLSKDNMREKTVLNCSKKSNLAIAIIT